MFTKEGETTIATAIAVAATIERAAFEGGLNKNKIADARFGMKVSAFVIALAAFFAVKGLVDESLGTVIIWCLVGALHAHAYGERRAKILATSRQQGRQHQRLRTARAQLMTILLECLEKKNDPDL